MSENNSPEPDPGQDGWAAMGGPAPQPPTQPEPPTNPYGQPPTGNGYSYPQQPQGPPPYPNQPPPPPGAYNTQFPPPMGGYNQQGPWVPQPVQPPKTPGFGFALSSLLVSIFLCCIGAVVAIPLAIVALVKSKGQPNSAAVKAMAIIAIVISFVWIAVAALFIVAGANSEPERGPDGQITKGGLLDTDEMRIGDCVTEVDVFDARSRVVPCTEPHDYKVVKIIPPISGTWRPEELTPNKLKELCGDGSTNWSVPDADSALSSQEPIACLAPAR